MKQETNKKRAAPKIRGGEIFSSGCCHITIRRCMDNQDGAIMVIALMVLLVITIIGLISSETMITENRIIRNQGIYQQNLNIVDSALMTGMQMLMQIPDDDSANFDPDTATGDLINDMRDNWADTTWYDPDSIISEQVLDAANSVDVEDAAEDILETRDELLVGNLRVSVVGWEVVSDPDGGSESIRIGKARQPAVWRQGRILAEYVSVDPDTGKSGGFGRMRMEMGVRRPIPIN